MYLLEADNAHSIVAIFKCKKAYIGTDELRNLHHFCLKSVNNSYR